MRLIFGAEVPAKAVVCAKALQVHLDITRAGPKLTIRWQSICATTPSVRRTADITMTVPAFDQQGKTAVGMA